MSAKYSVLIVIVVAALLAINSLWLSQSKTHLCPECEQPSQAD